ncbi:VOC family protein [Methylobacterium sp. E-045]|uniref:VOC family protein n=1 Tax=Methylobacterium sp. E-045 TaxID=2836575 RepID=UPI001FBB6E3F|nr:VOC family protein [Methylobacterium sp. E-045]MCJ2128100.1 VOC family protein [Methylobacterium sp. E-045]
MTALRIAAIRLLCPDPAATAAFYAAAFGATVASDGARLALGAQTIELVPASDPAAKFPPSNSTDFQHCALVVSDMDAAYAHLCGMPSWTPISRAGPERLPAASGGVSAFKFRDPDGHPLELLAFPPDAVPPVWRGRSGLVLGIDHTAITVADTERAVAFYVGLDFKVTSRSLNRGSEQARLDAIDDPVVEVTSLTLPGGAPPHLELLCYRAPGSILRNCPDGSPFATRIVLTGQTDRYDPDGHRIITDILGPKI